ncbi:hypothetical protein B0J14DRAFT_494153 [Halenospora varia]|nr:hypothetical protein B0J14DRAFT_494153 [Halenospora varia]
MFLVQSAVTCCALFWLLHRAWLTLWKPVPELISILGVEVPDSPEVSLAGIKADAVTLQWTRPEANKPVMKYLIQVNGVNVGDSSRTEHAITVTGLKPGHFYNVRVIAVGSNNFQAGSQVIRLQTYGRDGRPQVNGGRVPSNLSLEEQHNAADSTDEVPSVRALAAGIEAAPIPEGSQSMSREPSNSISSPRRNTGGRKHSPSNAAIDQKAFANSSKHPEESMQQLTEKFEAIRRETEEVMAQVSRDSEDYKSQILAYYKERDEKRQMLKEKDEASERLKKEVNTAERANRQAQNRKSQKEKILRDKQSEREKMHADVVRWRQEIDEMKKEREIWREEKQKLSDEREARAEELREKIRKRGYSLNGLEEEIRIKGLQIKELEEERKSLPGAQDDEESRERDLADKQREQEWEKRERELVAQLNGIAARLRTLESQYQAVQATFAQMSARQAHIPMYQQANSSGVDFDPNGQGKAKSRRSRNRKSRTGTISSPIAGYPITDSPYPSASAYNNLNTMTSPTFAPGPYFDPNLHNDTAMVPLSEQTIGMSEAEIRSMTAGAPLSPTASSLLPSTLFADDDMGPPSPRAGSTRSFGPALHGNRENEPQSPASSSRSASLISSPRASSHSLAMYGVSAHDHANDTERRSLNSPRTEFGAIGTPSPSDPEAPHKGFGGMFSFSKPRGKTMSQDSPALGSLKASQSQSFPRSTDEPGTVANRPRRVSFTSSWNVMPSFLQRSQTVTDAPEGNAPAPARNPIPGRRRRGFNMFGSSVDDPSAFPERDPSSPRPVSIASSDLPRPSTDSAPFGWPAAEGNVVNRNSPLATNWSVVPTQPWSRSASRRPSIQYASSAQLTSGIASEEDEFLEPDFLGQSSPPPVGVIGTRPPSSHKPVTPKLNPAAPTFKFMFGLSKMGQDKGKDKAKETPTESQDSIQNFEASSPPTSRKSRDTPSVHTQNSVAESTESLERTSSNTPSDIYPSGASTKDKESSFTRLLRKGSSSKFSLSSIRGKDSGLFSSKKGGGSSAANSDRADRDGSIDGLGDDSVFGKSVDSVTSSPMLGSGEWKGKDKESGTPKEGRMSVNWGRLTFKKGKGRESLDVDRSEAETTGTEDEGT